MKKRFLSLLVISGLLFSMAGNVMAADVKDFKDVSKSNWFYDEVDLVTDKGYFNGVAADRFAPYENMTRAMFVTALSRLDKAEVNNGVTKFDDVAKNTYYTGAVTWANDNGIVKGNGNGTFDPAGDITREQMCAIMDRYIEYFKENHEDYAPKTVNDTPSFEDMADVSAYAKEAVLNCVKYGLIEGYDGKFLPKENATRAEVAAVISRLEFVVYGGGGGAGGGGGGSRPSGPSIDTVEPEDLIGAAVRQTILDYNEYVNGKGISEYNTGFDMEAMDFNADENADNEREQVVEGKAFIGEDLVTEIIGQAAKSVCMILGEGTTKEEVSQIVDEVVTYFESNFGIDITRDNTIENLKEQVYDYAVEVGGNIWDNFQKDGSFVCGDITVSAGGHELTIQPSANGTTVAPAGKKAKAEVAAKMAFAVAKDMYADLTKNTTYTNEVEMEGTIDIHFEESENDEFAAKTADYPYDYPLNVVVTLDGGELVEYKYADNSFVKLNITDDIQEEYAGAVEDMIEAALQRDDVKKAVGAKIDAAVEAMTDSIEAKFGVNADAAVEDWKDANLNVDDLANSNAYKKYWEKDGTELNNDAIFNLVMDNAEYLKENGTLAEKLAAGVMLNSPEEVRNQINDLVTAEIEGHDMFAYLDKAIKVKSIEDMKDVRLGNLATALENATFQSYVDGKGDSIVDRVTDMIA
ncbi:MAG: S-layer homology domain-containing protein, partial [Firmicutes bacterium]|nr:S-layer homology domain-containing protein [Bacillota bacterium]